MQTLVLCDPTLPPSHITKHSNTNVCVQDHNRMISPKHSKIDLVTHDSSPIRTQHTGNLFSRKLNNVAR